MSTMTGRKTAISLSQILNLVGKLDDSSGIETPRERFRAFLRDNVKEVGQIRDYIEECLRLTGDQYNRALQDLVNHLGSLLGFEVQFVIITRVPRRRISRKLCSKIVVDVSFTFTDNPVQVSISLTNIISHRTGVCGFQLKRLRLSEPERSTISSMLQHGINSSKIALRLSI